MNKVEIKEWCPRCENESRLVFDIDDAMNTFNGNGERKLSPLQCEHCGKPLIPCAICPHMGINCNSCEIEAHWMSLARFYIAFIVVKRMRAGEWGCPRVWTSVLKQLVPLNQINEDLMRWNKWSHVDDEQFHDGLHKHIKKWFKDLTSIALKRCKKFTFDDITSEFSCMFHKGFYKEVGDERFRVYIDVHFGGFYEED